jgi:hypothetical protein
VKDKTPGGAVHSELGRNPVFLQTMEEELVEYVHMMKWKYFCLVRLFS